MRMSDWPNIRTTIQKFRKLALTQGYGLKDVPDEDIFIGLIGVLENLQEHKIDATSGISLISDMIKHEGYDFTIASTFHEPMGF